MVKSRRYKKRKSFRSRNRTRKQKLWNQKGCSHSKCHRCNKCLTGGDASIAPLSVSNSGVIRGGGCGVCMNENCNCASHNEMMGGSNGIFNGAIPGPIVGNHWGSNPGQWPGANGIGGDRNLLPYNTYSPVDVSRQMALRGGGGRGRKQSMKMKKRRALRGGGIIPQDLLNLGRDFGYNMESAYNSIRGMPAPVNPLPYKDQLMSQATRY